MKEIKSPQVYEETECLSLFLAGGISNCPPWQSEMVDLLKDTNLTLFNPRRNQFDADCGVNQIEWEYKHLNQSDAIMFWFCEETICPITLFELGCWIRERKKIIVGCHPNYRRKLDVQTQLKLYKPGDSLVSNSIPSLAERIIEWAES